MIISEEIMVTVRIVMVSGVNSSDKTYILQGLHLTYNKKKYTYDVIRLGSMNINYRSIVFLQ